MQPSPLHAGLAETFTPAAVRLAGLAGLALGWRPDEFWRATPTELANVLAPLAGEATAPPDPATLARLMEAHPDASPDR